MARHIFSILLIILLLITACAPEVIEKEPEEKIEETAATGIEEVDTVSDELNGIDELNDEDFALDEEDLELLNNI